MCPQDDEEEESGYTLQDIDAVLNAPPGGYLVASTPGVIGAQEVYRDPRQRIERQRALQQPSRPPGPEKLTFREKMRMFARETGEEHTPRDKMKISRAQREIETSLNGVPTPNRWNLYQDNQAKSNATVMQLRTKWWTISMLF